MPSPLLTTRASLEAALRYLAHRNALNRPVSLFFSDPAHGQAMRHKAARQSAAWHHYRETGRRSRI